MKKKSIETHRSNTGDQDTVNQPEPMDEAMWESEERFRLLSESVEEGIAIHDKSVILEVNQSLSRMFGYEVSEMIGMRAESFATPESWKITREHIDKGYDEPYEVIGVRKDGSTFECSVVGKPYKYRGRTLRVAVYRDITESKKAESQREAALEKLRESEERYKALFYRSLDMVYLSDFDGRFIDANDNALNRLGYNREEILSLNFASLLCEDQIPLALEIVQKIKENGIQKEINELKLRCKDGTYIYVETQGSAVMSNGKPIAIQGIARDITERKRTEEKLQQTLDSLRKAVGVTIQVLMSAIEARDPYTAGHQSRSADLARAIATEMGLCQDKIEGIRIAGSIHDIGKLSIPAEILSKPSKLTALEFSLIKGHSQSGYEMLKNVESPWPLAQIVYQHHERMNGSGYPRNLKGDEIILEARIMAVADVVEAMASHRPYRPGLGIEAALEEIEINNGLIYDYTVVGACLRLFRENGYRLKQDGKTNLI